MKTAAVFLCEYTGQSAQPWVDAGHDVILVDPQHAAGIQVSGQITTVGAVIDSPLTWNVLRQLLRTHRVVFMAGFPPCTDLAVSGSRWFEDKGKADPAFQFRAMQVVWQCHVIAEMLGCPYMIENPISRISSLWRKPDHIFNPWEYTAYDPSDNYTKKTCLWVGNRFVMPNPCVDATLGVPDSRIHTAPPGPNRANFRSATPKGFAQAVWQANDPDSEL